MLVLTRKAGEQIFIGRNIVLSVVDINGNRVRLGIQAPADVDIVRGELIGPPRKPVPAPPRDLRRRILIVDDSPEDRLMVRRYMSANGQRFDFAETDLGEKGLRLCREQAPDCVLLDYQLPDLDGLEFLKALRRDDVGRTIPVILFTGQGNEAIAVQAMKTGAQDYLVKQDVSPTALQRAVYEALRTTFMN